MEKNQIFENIMNRTSVRSYTDMPVEPEKVEMMLRAGMAAPSACNKQPWHFVVIILMRFMQVKAACWMLPAR